MIATQYIKSTTAKPLPLNNYETINVLKWSNSKLKTLCPYYLKTDGNEECDNQGEILFENFYQGCKVYNVVYENEVYPSRFQSGNPQYLWWKFTPKNPKGDVILQNNEVDGDLYLNWRNDLWNCKHPIRYPNKRNRRSQTQFSVTISKDGTQTRLNYINARKQIYTKEYIRLIKQLPEYQELLTKLQNN